MSLETFGDLIDRLAENLGMDQTSQKDMIGEWINEAGQEIYHAHAWPRRKMYAVLELADSVDVDADTGGLAGTLDSDVLTTIDARDFTAYEGYKIARDGVPSAEWYWINADHASTTTGALKVNYSARETFSAAAYTVYKDEYDFPYAVHSLLTEEVTLLGPDDTKLHQIHEADAADWWPGPTGLGVPFRFMLASTDGAPNAQDENAVDGSAEQLRIRIGPQVPDEPYKLRYGYLRRWRWLYDRSDIPVTGRDLARLIIDGALVLAYNDLDEFRDNTRLIQRQEARYLRELKQKIRNNRPLRPRVTYVRPFDKPSRVVGLRYNLPPED